MYWLVIPPALAAIVVALSTLLPDGAVLHAVRMVMLTLGIMGLIAAVGLLARLR